MPISSIGATWPARGVGALVLRYDRTPTERAVLDRWLSEVGAGEPYFACVRGRDLSGDGVGVGQSDDTLVVPVAVGWWSPRDDGRDGWRNALATVNELIPLSRLQRRILDESPERVRIVIGEPAQLGELRRRYEQRTGNGDSFAAFIQRPAVGARSRRTRGEWTLQATAPGTGGSAGRPKLRRRRQAVGGSDWAPHRGDHRTGHGAPAGNGCDSQPVGHRPL